MDVVDQVVDEVAGERVDRETGTVAARSGAIPLRSGHPVEVVGELLLLPREGDPLLDLAEIGIAGAAVTARAIARAIYAATPAPGDLVPTWRERFG